MTGFPGFQARLEAMIQTLGGDWLAERAAMRAWDVAVSDWVRELPMVKDKHYDFWAWRSPWTRFADADWLAAAEMAERSFRAAVAEPRGEGMAGDFRVVWDDRRLVRPGTAPGVGILLASAYEGGRYQRGVYVPQWTINWTDDAMAWARRHGPSPIKTVHARSGDAAVKTMARIAKELGVR